MPEMQVEQPKVLDILDTKGAPALSSTSDMPVIETKPDATNEGKPPEKPQAAEAAPAEGKTTPESATGAEDEETPASDAPKKPAKGVQKRLDELTRQREEAERRAKAAEENLARALEAMKQPKPAAEEPKDEAPAKDAEDTEPVRPKRADFPDPDAYDAAVDAYIAEKAAHTARREVQAARAADEQARTKAAEEAARKSVIDAHSARVEKAKAAHEDWQQFAESPDVQITVPMAAAILQHEQGPEIQYFLGKNPAEAERIAKLSPPAQLLELGLIAAGLRAPAAPAAAAAPAAPETKPLTKAPPPARPAAAGATSVTKSLDEMTMEEYAAARKPQLTGQRQTVRR